MNQPDFWDQFRSIKRELTEQVTAEIHDAKDFDNVIRMASDADPGLRERAVRVIMRSKDMRRGLNNGIQEPFCP